jgi:SAM-dependent methyltransferase
VKVEYGPATYGDRVADVYDEWYKLPHNLETEATFLTELAAGGRVLELGIGTGRIAIPLSQRGVDIHGIDSSATMVEKMRAKPGGDAIPVTIGDMADVPVDSEFALVFVTFNTFFMLTSQEAQVRCFRNVAAHLAPGGRFVIRAFVPDLSRIEAGQNLSVREAGLDRVRFDTAVYDPVTQTFDVTQVRLTERGSRFVHAKMRYAFPPEIDLMAQLAGLSLEARYATFDKQPFTSESAFHVSVYRA